MRLILAYLADTPDEIAFYVWAVMAESGLTEQQFRLADQTAREAARWWRRSPESIEKARVMLTKKLEKLTAAA